MKIITLMIDDEVLRQLGTAIQVKRLVQNYDPLIDGAWRKVIKGIDAGDQTVILKFKGGEEDGSDRGNQEGKDR